MPRIQMPKPHLAIEQAENMIIIDVRRHRVNGGPRRVLKEPVADALERRLIHLVDLVHVLLTYVPVHVNCERFHRIGYVIRVVPHCTRVSTVDRLFGVVQRRASHGGSEMIPAQN